MKLTALLVLVAGVVLAGAGCASTPQAAAKPKHVTFSAGLTMLLFYDHDTGEIWGYSDPTKPAERMGRLESFDKPLIDAATLQRMQSEQVKEPPPAVAQNTAPRTEPPPVIRQAPPPVVKNGGQPGILAQMNALPKNLWPTKDENAVKRELREKWFAENLKLGEDTIAGVLSGVSTRDESKKIVARIEVEKVDFLGEQVPLYVYAELAGLKREDVVDWKEGDAIVVTGTLTKAEPGTGILSTRYAFISLELTKARRVK